MISLPSWQRIQIWGLLFLLAATSASGQDAQVDFAKQIVPMFTKAGCNSGACHGAAAGRGYLALSLFGAQPRDDYETLVFSIAGRYVDTQQPISSWIIQKPGGYLEHAGGVRIDPDTEAFQLLTSWLEDGATQGSLAELKELTVLPANTFECRVGNPVELSAVAKWNDGDERPVSEWLVVEGAKPAGSENAPVTYEPIENADHNHALQLTAHLPGYWPVTLRFGATVQTVQLWVRAEDDRPQARLDAVNAIDQLISLGNQRIGQEPAAGCEPHILARRLWIDLLGRHPTQSEWQQATEAIKAGDLESVVDPILASEGFRRRAGEVVSNWVVAASTDNRLGSIFAPFLASAISDALDENDDLQALAQQMLLVEDAPKDLNSFHVFASDPRTRAELVASVWMGVRVGCAQCHDHPLDHWTQDDYFALAACWAEIETEDRGARRIPQRTTTDLRTGRAAVARLPGKQEAYSAGTIPADMAFIAWLCSEDNPQFAANLVNRVWYWLLGSGLVEEVDDHRQTNPAINPELLSHLSKTLIDSDYSLRVLVREIVLSDAYARSSDAKAALLQKRLCGVRHPKSINIPLEQLVGDALEIHASDSGASSGNAPAMAMMMVQEEPGCKRGQICSDPLGESLELAAGNALNELVSQAVSQSFESRDEPMKVLDDFYQRLFGTSPDASAREQWVSLLQAPQTKVDPRVVVEDLLWSWVVSDDFRLLH